MRSRRAPVEMTGEEQLEERRKMVEWTSSVEEERRAAERVPNMSEITRGHIGLSSLRAKRESRGEPQSWAGFGWAWPPSN